MDRKTDQKVSAVAPGKAWLGLAARLIVGGVLVFSGALKTSSPTEEFAVVIENYGIVGSDAAQSLAALLPWAELTLGFSLIFGYFTPAASAGAGAMFLLFIAAILSTKARGIELPNCGCFGERFHPSPLQAALLDACLLALSAVSFAFGRLRLSLDKWCDGGYT